jgi:hypothetical protein
MTKDEALKLALEALERGETELRWKAITAIKEALAQPETRPTTREEKIVRPGVYERVTYGEAWSSDGTLVDVNDLLPEPEERNFCPRCGKRLASGFVEISIHTCTPPKGKT